MVEFNRSFYIFGWLNRILRVCDAYFCLENVIDTKCCHVCSRKHDGHGCDHQEGHDDLHCVLDECHNVTYLHGSVINGIGTAVNDQYGNAIHDQHHSRHHKGHASVDEQVCLCQSLVCFLKTFFFVFLTAECTDDRDTGKDLTCYQVQFIDQCL